MNKTEKQVRLNNLTKKMQDNQALIKDLLFQIDEIRQSEIDSKIWSEYNRLKFELEN